MAERLPLDATGAKHLYVAASTDNVMAEQLSNVASRAVNATGAELSNDAASAANVLGINAKGAKLSYVAVSAANVVAVNATGAELLLDELPPNPAVAELALDELLPTLLSLIALNVAASTTQRFSSKTM